MMYKFVRCKLNAFAAPLARLEKRKLRDVDAQARRHVVLGHWRFVIGISRRRRAVGMTEEVIKNYFTQIGKSYYRSPEFNQKRAAMKVAGGVVSPISIFGCTLKQTLCTYDTWKVQ